MIYVLMCIGNQQSEKYYVGYSKTRDSMWRRIDQHFDGVDGAMWTQVYPPVRVEEFFEGDFFDEESTVLRYMAEYGIENVRGGSYSSFQLSIFDQDRAQVALRSITQCCFVCGSKDHFSKHCKGREVTVCPEPPTRCGHCGHRYRNCTKVEGGYVNFDLLPCLTCSH
jgi:hypothetical protein